MKLVIFKWIQKEELRHFSFISKSEVPRGMFETQKFDNKTSSGEVGLNIRKLASLKIGQDQALYI